MTLGFNCEPFKMEMHSNYTINMLLFLTFNCFNLPVNNFCLSR